MGGDGNMTTGQSKEIKRPTRFPKFENNFLKINYMPILDM